jgi:Rieske Fe-S protein
VLVLQAGDQLHAFSAKCTHEGCTVTFLPGQSVIWCPCHDGRFDLNGRVLSGPPPQPCLHISSNANLTVESSFHKNEPDVQGSGKSRGLRGWLDRRYQLTPLVEFLRHKEVPIGSHWMGWYYLGGITMFFFVVQVITGVLLLMYYQPGEATAYESISFSDHQGSVRVVDSVRS